MRKLYIVLAITTAFLVNSCGGGGSGTSSSSSESGGDINDAWAITELDCSGTVTGGTFTDGTGAVVDIEDGEMSTCVNAASDPTIQTASLPDGFDIRSSEGDINVTEGGNGYAFSINGTSGFDTTSTGAVTITLPFDNTDIPSGDRTNGTLIFVRIFNNDDSSLADLTGTISGGTITVETRGLPPARVVL